MALLPPEVVGALAEVSWITAGIPAKVTGAVWLTMASLA
jgi:hypothetical protein